MEKLKNTDMIEIEAISVKIRNMEVPIKVLEYISTTKPEMFNINDDDYRIIRFIAYAEWLQKFNIEWYEYLMLTLKVLNQLVAGKITQDDLSQTKKAPEGYIIPIPYLMKGLKNDKDK